MEPAIRKDTLVVLGGGIKKNSQGIWTTLSFEDGDQFGVTNDRLRVVAAAHIFRSHPGLTIIASGGLGQNKNIPGAPTVAAVIKRELMALDVPAERIIEENTSGNTYQQLIELKRLTRERDLKGIAIISNEWHLPRITAMIEQIPLLRSLLCVQTLTLVGAEAIVSRYDPRQYNITVQAYATTAMGQRILKENEGISQIRKGIYKFTPVFSVRRAVETDSRFLLDLRNDTLVRENSFNHGIVSQEAHDKWYAATLINPRRALYVAEVDYDPAGQVRFDVYDNGQEAEISISIAPQARGKGYAAPLLQAGAMKFRTEFPDVNLTHAYILHGNIGSQKAFTAAGYTLTDETEHEGHQCLGMILQRP